MKKLKKFLVYGLLSLALLALVGVLLVTVRNARAMRQIEQEAQVRPTPVTNLGSVQSLEILPLFDGAGDASRFAIGHGVSYLVRADTTTLLLDVGYNLDESGSRAMQNMQALGIAWDDIDAVVLSHPHPDHMGSQPAWLNNTLFLGDAASGLSGKTIYAPTEINVPGASVVPAGEPLVLGPGLGTTGVLSFPDVFPLSLLEPRGVEQGLVVNVASKGLVLITGCGHPTLERLVERAEAVYGLPVVGVVGGLHYGEAGAETLQPHIQFLAQRQPQLVALSPHDSEAPAQEAFAQAFPSVYRAVEVGQAIQFP